MNSLKVKGMNAIFGLKISLSISDRIMIATALGTGVHLSGLAAPTPPRLVLHRDDKGGFQLVDLIIADLKSHMTC